MCVRGRGVWRGVQRWQLRLCIRLGSGGCNTPQLVLYVACVLLASARIYGMQAAHFAAVL
jgi:hypothetical protein